MKNLNITFTDKQFLRLKLARNKSKCKTWEFFILMRCAPKKKETKARVCNLLSPAKKLI